MGLHGKEALSYYCYPLLHTTFSFKLDCYSEKELIWLVVAIQFATFRPYLSTVPPGLLGDLHLIRICRLSMFGIVLPFFIVAKDLLPLVHIAPEGWSFTMICLGIQATLSLELFLGCWLVKCFVSTETAWCASIHDTHNNGMLSECMLPIHSEICRSPVLLLFSLFSMYNLTVVSWNTRGLNSLVKRSLFFCFLKDKSSAVYPSPNSLDGQ